MSDLNPMKPGDVFSRIRERLERLERDVRRSAAAPLRNASIDGPVVVSPRGVVSVTTSGGGTTSLSQDGAVSTAADGSQTRLNEGAAETRTSPSTPWQPIDQGAIDAAAGALDAAQDALDAANTKSTIIRATTDAPGGPQPSYKSGDEWRKMAADGLKVLAVWQHNGTQFVTQQLTGTMLTADAIDGKTITGALVQTSATAQRGVKLRDVGLIGYDPDGNAKTVIDATTGKITATDGTFTGTVTGASVVGGAVSIAEGAETTLTQNFESATATAPPTGWNLGVGSSSTGSADFPALGPSGERVLRLVTPASVANGSEEFRSLYSESLTGRDFDISFAHKWTGGDDGPFGRLEQGLLLRGVTTGSSSYADGTVRINLAGGWVAAIAGSNDFLTDYSAPRAAADTWYRYRVTLRGQSVRVIRSDLSGNILYTFNATLTANSQLSGKAFFYSNKRFKSSNQPPASTMMVGNISASVLRVGFVVTPNGSVEASTARVTANLYVPTTLTADDSAVPRIYSDAGDAEAKKRANHTGSPSTHWSNGGFRIISLADGVGASDAINKGQLDARTGIAQASRYRASDVALPSSTSAWTTVNFDSATSDIGITWDTTNLRYVIVTAARYQINSAVLLLPQSGVTTLTRILKNTTVIAQTILTPPGAAFLLHPINIADRFAAGDTITIQVQSQGASTSLVGGNLRYTRSDVSYIGP